jgi:phasin family protein
MAESEPTTALSAVTPPAKQAVDEAPAEPVVAPVEPEASPRPVAEEPTQAEQLTQEQLNQTEGPSDPEPEAETPTPQMAESVALFPGAAATVTKGTTIMTDAMETAKGYAEEAKTRMQSAFTEMNEKTKTAMEKSARAFEELGELAKGNLEAVVESSKIAAKGVESLGQEAAEYGRKSFEKTSATMKSFAAIKSPAEFFQLQSELMSSTMDHFAAEASKSSEAMLKLMNDISQPISNRVSVVTEKMKSIAA